MTVTDHSGNVSGSGQAAAPGNGHTQKVRRRRPPSASEQARRVAWGKRESAQEVALKRAGRWTEEP